MQEFKEIGRKKAGEWTDFSILWMGIIEDVLQMEGKECKDQEKLKMCREKIHARAKKVQVIGNFA